MFNVFMMNSENKQKFSDEFRGKIKYIDIDVVVANKDSDIVIDNCQFVQVVRTQYGKGNRIFLALIDIKKILFHTLGGVIN